MLVLLVLAGCGRPQGHRSAKGGATTGDFRPEVTLPTTPVQQQGRSELCWAYAMLATIETEHLVQGDSVCLSPDFPARMWLSELVSQRFLAAGMDGTGQNGISLRGMAPMLVDLLEQYGAVPYDTYHNYDGVNYRALCRTLNRITRMASSLNEARRAADNAMDRAIGFLLGNGGGDAREMKVFMLGAAYTPLEFAHSVCLPGEWVAVTSFTHHPFGESFVLETPDNMMRDRFLNLPVDSMVALAERSIRQGHPVCWEGDISEAGFSHENGVATMGWESSPPNSRNAQERRQWLFERRLTTDDHCMELCGLARDAKDNLFFLAKNSWGTGNPYGGYMYLSREYVRMKTIALMVNVNALPASWRPIRRQR